MFTTVAELRTTAMIGMELEIIGSGRERENVQVGENPRPGPGFAILPLIRRIYGSSWSRIAL